MSLNSLASMMDYRCYDSSQGSRKVCAQCRSVPGRAGNIGILVIIVLVCVCVGGGGICPPAPPFPTLLMLAPCISVKVAMAI
jgi:hypothetical protein